MRPLQKGDGCALREYWKRVAESVSDFPAGQGSLRWLSAGPTEAGAGVMVMTTRPGIFRLKSLAKRLDGMTTFIGVFPPPAETATIDDVEEYAEQLALALPSGVHTVIGHSVAGYLAARLARTREALQDRRPTLIMLEPPLPDDLMTCPLSDLLSMPKLVLDRFVASIEPGPLVSCPRGTPEFHRQLVHVLTSRRVELDAAVRSVDPSELLAPPNYAVDLYTEWAGWVSLCMQLCTTRYEGPTILVEGLLAAGKGVAARADRFARIRESFPTVRLEETGLTHGELVCEATLFPHLSQDSPSA